MVSGDGTQSDFLSRMDALFLERKNRANPRNATEGALNSGTPAGEAPSLLQLAPTTTSMTVQLSDRPTVVQPFVHVNVSLRLAVAPTVAGAVAENSLEVIWPESLVTATFGNAPGDQTQPAGAAFAVTVRVQGVASLQSSPVMPLQPTM